jgi:hypothetical protein
MILSLNIGFGISKKKIYDFIENKEAFVNGITNWISDPKEENSLIRGVVSQFKVMPKLFY